MYLTKNYYIRRNMSYIIILAISLYSIQKKKKNQIESYTPPLLRILYTHEINVTEKNSRAKSAWTKSLYRSKAEKKQGQRGKIDFSRALRHSINQQKAWERWNFLSKPAKVEKSSSLTDDADEHWTHICIYTHTHIYTRIE